MPIEALVAYFRQTGEKQQPAQHIQFLADGVHGHYQGMRLSSVYQPLFDVRSLSAVAHEALLRVIDSDNRILAPAAAFAVPVTPDEVVYFDRLCRIVHALNFVRQAGPDAELFLNVSGRHLLSVETGGHGQTFERLLAMCELKPQRIILEVLEARVDDLERFNDAVESYRQRGYRVAIDDFGCEHSNFDRLWRLTPDIVKLDRSLIVQATSNPRARRILPRIIEIIHELGATVVCEGIETAEQHQLAEDAGTDLVQGYYYARPSPALAHRAAPVAIGGSRAAAATQTQAQAQASFT